MNKNTKKKEDKVNVRRGFKVGDVYRPQGRVMEVKNNKPYIMYIGGQIFKVIDDDAKRPF